MKELLTNLGKLAKDKILHQNLSLYLALIFLIIFPKIMDDKSFAIFLSWISALAIGLGYELYQQLDHKGAEKRDFIWDFIGATIGTILGSLIMI